MTMKKLSGRLLVCFVLLTCILTCILTGCSKLEKMNDQATAPAPVVVKKGRMAEEDGQDQELQTDGRQETVSEASSETEEGANQRTDQGTEKELQTAEIVIDPAKEREPVKVKGIYISAYVAGTPAMVDRLIEEIDRTEANALVIDLKDDFGRVACEMDSDMVREIGSVKTYISDIEGLMRKLDDHGIYAIARIPAFRDAWLGDVRPEWCVKKADGSVFRDRDGNAWVNPYKREAWDYLIEIAVQAKRLGFDEVQFDYVRFCTERGMKEAVFDEAEVDGRSRTDIICEFMEYAYEKLRREGLFVSADVFGAIINSDVNADSVGQIYGEMAKHLDYISPMIYPSHYGDGNCGIEHPDLQPYETISAALEDSRKELYFAGIEGEHVAEVRPWLQDFTATWLTHHITYGPEQVRAQIQATYDAGYDEWLLWDASCKYGWEGLLTPEAAEQEAKQIAQLRASLPEPSYAPETTAEETEKAEETEEAAEQETGETAGQGSETAAGSENGAEAEMENGGSSE